MIVENIIIMEELKQTTERTKENKTKEPNNEIINDNKRFHVTIV
jgi:hypothetical protein